MFKAIKKIKLLVLIMAMIIILTAVLSLKIRSESAVSSAQIADERYTIFNEVDSQKIFDELNKNKANLADRLISEGFLEKANDNAKVLIESILMGMGFKEVGVEFDLN